MEEVYIVTWFCKYTKKRKTFLFTGFIDDVINKRVLFTNEDLDEVLTLASDSYAWMVTRPNDMNYGNN